MKKNKKLKYVILLIIVAIIGFFVKNLFTEKKVDVIPEIYTVEKGNIKFTYNEKGTVESEKIVSVYATTAGSVKNVKYRLWDEVKKGDILLDLDEKSIDDLNTTIEINKLKLLELKNTVRLNEELYNNGLLSKNEYEKSKLNLEVANLELKKLLNEKNKVELYVKAPISGVITELNADNNYKIDLSKPLFKISDTDNLKIIVSLVNIKSKNVNVGDKVHLSSDSLDDNLLLEGKVVTKEKISYYNKTYGDSETNVVIKLNDNNKLKPGDEVNVEIEYKNLENVLLLPTIYINTDENNNTFVYLVENNVVVKRNVVLGDNDSYNYVVLEGLKENDKVLNNSSMYFKEGDKLDDKGNKSK